MRSLLAILVAILFVASVAEAGRTHGSRIVGGQHAASGQFNWVVKVDLATSGGYCTGSILSEEWILSAAHCFSKDGSDVVKIRAGSIDGESGGQYVTATSYVVHPQYDDVTSKNDIALVKVPALTFSTTVNKVLLASSDAALSVGTVLYGAGFGDTKSTTDTAIVLRYVDLPYYDFNKCNTDWYSGDLILNNMICAGYDDGTFKDTCQGDSGGPLFMTSDITSSTKANTVVYGATSFGIGCGVQPGVYADIANFGKAWVDSIVGFDTGVDSSTNPSTGTSSTGSSANPSSGGSAVCGNGVVETGETCDTPYPTSHLNKWRKFCCDPSTCTLLPKGTSCSKNPLGPYTCQKSKYKCSRAGVCGPRWKAEGASCWENGVAGTCASNVCVTA